MYNTSGSRGRKVRCGPSISHTFQIFHNITSLSCRILFFCLVSFLLPDLNVWAAERVEVTVSGVEGELHMNVLARLTIYLHRESERLQAPTVKRLHRQAEEDIRSALAPLGYYNPVTKGVLLKTREGWQAEYVIDKGPPVRVGEVSIVSNGPGRDNPAIREAIAAFPVKKGDVLNQEVYEEGKKKLVNIAFGEGYLDAALPQRALRINRETNDASVNLVLDTGELYLFGKTTSRQQIIRPDLLDRYLPYREGEPYSPAKLFELQSTLYRTDYFSRVAVRGLPEKAADHAIPVEVDLTAPEHRNKYGFGLGYATDTGARGKIDWSNRLFNTHGHRANATLQLAERENILSFLYQMPVLKDPRYYKIVGAVSYQDRNWEDTETELFTSGVNLAYDGPVYQFGTGLELRDELYDVGDTSGDSTLLVPSLNIGFILADDILETQNGLQASLGVLGGVNGLISDVSFLQATLSGKGVLTPLDDWRLIGRGSVGATLVDSIDSLPPSLRFYTGGDTSIRGYRYKSIGTRDSSGAVIGGRYLAVGSIELERHVYKQWSVATFWDGGTATDDLTLNFFQGVGAGIRFRLPFGQIRLDVASAVTEDDTPLRLHFNVGGDL